MRNSESIKKSIEQDRFSFKELFKNDGTKVLQKVDSKKKSHDTIETVKASKTKVSKAVDPSVEKTKLIKKITTLQKQIKNFKNVGIDTSEIEASVNAMLSKLYDDVE